LANAKVFATEVAGRTRNGALAAESARLGGNVREAYVRLQAYAFAHGRLLDDVAHDVVHRGLQFDEDPDPV
jgi:hypothetical protein